MLLIYCANCNVANGFEYYFSEMQIKGGSAADYKDCAGGTGHTTTCHSSPSVILRGVSYNTSDFPLNGSGLSQPFRTATAAELATT